MYPRDTRKPRADHRSPMSSPRPSRGPSWTQSASQISHPCNISHREFRVCEYRERRASTSSRGGPTKTARPDVYLRSDIHLIPKIYSSRHVHCRSPSTGSEYRNAAFDASFRALVNKLSLSRHLSLAA